VINQYLMRKKMRKARIRLLAHTKATPDHPKAKELVKISEILDNNNSIYDLVLQDLGKAGNATLVPGA
jgi:hypothetical protein